MEAQGQGDEFAIGCVLSIKTTLGEEFQAQVISFDRPSNLLILHILAKIQSLNIHCPIYISMHVYKFQLFS